MTTQGSKKSTAVVGPDYQCLDGFLFLKKLPRSRRTLP